MIYFYCALRNPTGRIFFFNPYELKKIRFRCFSIEYAVSTERGFCENSTLILNACALNTKQRDRVKQGESVEQVIEYEEPVETAATEPEPR